MKRKVFPVCTIRSKGGGKIKILHIPDDNEIAVHFIEDKIVRYLTPRGATELGFVMLESVAKLLRKQESLMPSHTRKERAKRKKRRRKTKLKKKR